MKGMLYSTEERILETESYLFQSTFLPFIHVKFVAILGECC